MRVHALMVLLRTLQYGILCALAASVHAGKCNRSKEKHVSLSTAAAAAVLQAGFGFTGLLVVTIYALVTDPQAHADTSKGFALPLGDGLFAKTPGYAGPLDCVDPATGASTCDNYAYPAGDMAVNNRGMADVDAYAPFPNAILMNWATLIVLSLGNLCALDFQVCLEACLALLLLPLLHCRLTPFHTCIRLEKHQQV